MEGNIILLGGPKEGDSSMPDLAPPSPKYTTLNPVSTSGGAHSEARSALHVEVYLDTPTSSSDVSQQPVYANSYVETAAMTDPLNETFIDTEDITVDIHPEDHESQERPEATKQYHDAVFSDTTMAQIFAIGDIGNYVFAPDPSAPDPEVGEPATTNPEVGSQTDQLSHGFSPEIGSQDKVMTSLEVTITPKEVSSTVMSSTTRSEVRMDVSSAPTLETPRSSTPLPLPRVKSKKDKSGRPCPLSPIQYRGRSFSVNIPSSYTFIILIKLRVQNRLGPMSTRTLELEVPEGVSLFRALAHLKPKNLWFLSELRHKMIPYVQALNEDIFQKALAYNCSYGINGAYADGQQINFLNRGAWMQYRQHSRIHINCKVNMRSLEKTPDPTGGLATQLYPRAFKSRPHFLTSKQFTQNYPMLDF